MQAHVMFGLLALCASAGTLAAEVAEIPLRRGGTESGVLKAPAPPGTTAACRSAPPTWDATQLELHGREPKLRVLECFAKAGARAPMRPLYSVSIHPATLDVPVSEADFNLMMAPPISSDPLEETPEAGQKTITQWIPPPGKQRFMDCRKVTTMHGKRTHEVTFACTRYVYVDGWAIALGMLDQHSDATAGAMPGQLEAWATQFAAANARK
jgi:hypothetical protein